MIWQIAGSNRMPNYTATLQAAAEELLQNTNEVYDECSDGIAELDRIIVSVAALRVEATRSYLIPILYAYWERFFRTAFTEYIRVLSDAAIGFGDCHVPIAVVRVRQELAAFARQAGAPQLHELSDCYSFEELSTLFEEFSSWLARPVQFRDPENWVSTDGNVQFRVLEKNCRIIGLDAG
ncbi:MAG: MAE_28990/MAE_18760 family HEPN-like nuclease, partial [Verrucomicrobiota bacterium]|nr:MAE_28990/MAE_18760 family HEPN-like nuclease [Verrucomicrobiota bacterium]